MGITCVFNSIYACVCVRFVRGVRRCRCFAKVDFSLLEARPSWPPPSHPERTQSHKKDKRSRNTDKRARAVEFLDWLRGRSERVVVLVSHHNLLQGLLQTTESIPNCLPIVVELNEAGEIGLASSEI
eukprot:COSAG05_NODE_11013_length_534_cov_1.733333_1_plen_127_part_00